MVDTIGVIYAGRNEGMNMYKARFARKDDGARTLADAMRGADVFLGLLEGGARARSEMLKTMAPQPHHLRARQPRSRDQLPGRQGGAPRRDRRHGAQRLPEPGQQRARLPVHLPGRAGRAGQGHQRGDEARGGARAGGSWRTRRCPTRVAEAYGVRRVSASAPTTSSRSRSTRACCGGSRRRWPRRRWTRASARLTARHRRVPRAPPAPHRRRAAHDHAPHRPAGEERAQAHRLPRRRQHQGAARLPDRARRGHRAPDPARQRAEDPAARRRAGPGSRRSRDRQPRRLAEHSALRARFLELRCRKGITAANAQRLMNRRIALRHDDGARAATPTAGRRPDHAATPTPSGPRCRSSGIRPGVRRATGMYMMLLKNDVKFFADATRQHRSRRRDAGRHRHPGGRRGPRLRDHAAHRDDLVLELRVGAAPRVDQGRAAVELVRKRRPDLEIDGEVQADIAVEPERCASCSRSRA